jgi:hypothetical protein
LQTRVFTQFRQVWPVLDANQRGIANLVRVLSDTDRIVLLPDRASRDGEENR